MLDLFEQTDTLPADVRAWIAEFSTLLESGAEDGYAVCHEFLAVVELLGYTFQFGLDAVPHSLRPLAGGPFPVASEEHLPQPTSQHRG